ncbi:MAG: hypothetical protein C0473_03940 [Cyanobacteria bacterium DS3.002]|nr:hypothetical protein [Cyanobacteria bacterium DS3.002]MBA4049927.1 hypothetical protein [Cyanobacteria bacterium DS2.008]MBA4079057.1 hypothetical protein [Cyanobacteria bacterium PR.023]
MAILPEKLTELLKLLQKTNEDEIDCDAFWEIAAELSERDTLDIDELKGYLHHLELCPGCAEEFALLKAMVNDD